MHTGRSTLGRWGRRPQHIGHARMHGRRPWHIIRPKTVAHWSSGPKAEGPAHWASLVARQHTSTSAWKYSGALVRVCSTQAVCT